MEILENRDEWYAAYQQGWLAHFEATGQFDWSIYNRPTNKEAFGLPGIDLSQSRLLFISSAGAYLPESQEVYDDENPIGDYTIRRIPSDTPLSKIAYAHTHYNHQYVEADPQVLVPLDHLRTMVSEGIIGELAPSMISFMGYLPDATRLVDETIPEIVRVAKEEQAQAALLVPA